MENSLPPAMPTDWKVQERKEFEALKMDSFSEKRRRPLQVAPWVVENMLAEEEITIIAADSGTGKSWKALHIARCVTTGAWVDGVLKTKPGNVVWIDNENGPYENDRRAHLFEPDKLDEEMGKYDIYFIEEGVAISKELIDRLHTIIEEKQPRLLVIDPLVASLPSGASENSATDMRPLFTLLQRLIRFDKDGKKRVNGPACLILHHTAKDTKNGSTYRGSSDIKGAGSMMLMMEKVEGEDGREFIHTKWVKCRIGPQPELKLSHQILKAIDSHGEECVEYKSYGWLDKPLKIDEEELVLMNIREGEEVSSRELIERIEGAIHERTIYRKIKSLVEKGLVKQRIDKGQDNTKFYSKTKTGI